MDKPVMWLTFTQWHMELTWTVFDKTLWCLCSENSFKQQKIALSKKQVRQKNVLPEFGLYAVKPKLAVTIIKQYPCLSCQAKIS